MVSRAILIPMNRPTCIITRPVAVRTAYPSSGDMREAWKGLKTLTGQYKPQESSCRLSDDKKSEFAELNDFYCRFERTNLRGDLLAVVSDLRDKMEKAKESSQVFEIQASAVESKLKRVNSCKAPGPDNVCGRLLKSCSAQLCSVFSQLFSWSLRDCQVPSVWKNSIICPVPKSRCPSELNDYRPVALTSIVMKCFERIVLKIILSQTQHSLDPLQFAYRQNRSTDDATLTVLNNAYIHLEKPGSFVQTLFIDFSSAFNTIQPHVMALKLQALDVNPRLILWIVSFLTNRTQSVCFQRCLSSCKTTFTGSPQGTVLSPVLFTLYTNDCTGSLNTPLIKYSDDSALQDLSNSHSVYLKEVDKFITWCNDNYLNLNVKKTKELIIDFRRNPEVIPDLVINDEKVERVLEYKYLGTVLDHKLTFNSNTRVIQKKCQPRIYFLQKLRSLGVNQSVLGNFYRCFIQPVLTFGFLCWFGGLSVKNRNVLMRIVNMCGKVVGDRQMSMSMMYERQAIRKATVIVRDPSHILTGHYQLLPSGRRFETPKVSTARAARSFVPQSIQLINSRGMI